MVLVCFGNLGWVCLYVWFHYHDAAALHQLQVEVGGAYALENFYVQG